MFRQHVHRPTVACTNATATISTRTANSTNPDNHKSTNGTLAGEQLAKPTCAVAYLRLKDAMGGLFPDIQAYEAKKAALASRIQAAVKLPQHMLRSMNLSEEQAGALERYLGANDLVDVNYLSRGMTAAATVARVNGYDPSKHRTFSASGFMVGPRLFMTNRHVFPDADVARQSQIEFGYELDDNKRWKATEKYRLVPEDGFLVGDSDDLDFTLVAVAPVSENGVPLSKWGHLQLDGRPGKVSEGEFITIIQHPSGGLKQVSLRENQLISKGPSTLLYRSDTAPGSSGSPCFNDDWQVVAIHSQGVPKEGPGGKIMLHSGRLVDMTDLDQGTVREDDVVWEANRGVRISTIVDAVRSMAARGSTATGPLIAAFLEAAESPLSPKPLPPSQSDGQPSGMLPVALPPSASQPVNVLPVNGGTTTGAGIFQTHTVTEEKGKKRPSRGSDDADGDGRVSAGSTVDSNGATMADRRGYDPEFLGVRVMLPVISADTLETFGNPYVLPQTGSTEIKYTHFSVVLNEQRRLAYVSAVNIDGASTVKLDRESKFKLDPRVPTALQCGEWLYANNVLDRGHITRRNDAVWGNEAARGNSDTFYFTNIAPQHKDFNQGKTLWQGLENFVLDNTEGEGVRASVFSGPIFGTDDRIYRGVPIPQEFFKVVVVASGSGQLRSSAYIVSQKQLVAVGGDLPDEAFTGAAALQEQLPVGPFRTFQVPLSEVEELTGLMWDAVVQQAEVFAPAFEAAVARGEAGPAAAPARRELHSFADIVLK